MFEGLGVFDDKDRKDFSVYGDVGFFEFIDEDAVGDVFLFDGFGDAGYPQSAEVSFAEFAAVVGVLVGVEGGLLGYFYQAAFCAAIAFGSFFKFVMFSAGDHPAFYSCHIMLLLTFSSLFLLTVLLRFLVRCVFFCGCRIF